MSDVNNNLNVLNSLSELAANLSIDRVAGVTSIVLGHPGIAKTEAVGQLVAEPAFHPAGFECDETFVPAVVGFYASQHEGTDLSGYPVLTQDGEALTFKVMQKLRALRPGDALVIDEFTLAEPSTLKPCLQLLSGDRPCVNDFIGPEHVQRVALGNLADSGNLDYLYNPVMGNRVALYEFAGPTVEEWLTYAMLNGVHPAIVTSIKMEGAALLLDWDPSRERNPTPRSWFNASRKLLAAEAIHPDGVPLSIRMTQLATCVGDAAALQVETLLTMQDKLVPYATVVANPDTCMVPDGLTDPAAQFLMATHVANKCVPDDWSAVAVYIQRFPIELQATMVAPIVARHPVLFSTKEYANFASRTSGLL